MHRFYVDEVLEREGQSVTFSAEESAHASRVLRLREGEKIQLLDGVSLWNAELKAVAEKGTTAVLLSPCPCPESQTHVTLYQGLPKGDKLEMIAQKATEMGVWDIIAVESERSVARLDKADRAQKKQLRLQRIALEAAKQSGRAHVPQIGEMTTFQKALQKMLENKPDLILTAWEEEKALPLSQAVRDYVKANGTPKTAAVWIGPEGGISQEEWQMLHDAGAVSVTLGRRILRTETAGICALSVLWATLGEM